MTAARISSALRKEVRERAKGCCEYCLLPEAQAFFPHEPDHVIATKHGGESTIENLALACFDCNRFKGSDIASIDPFNGKLTQLFDRAGKNGRSISASPAVASPSHRRRPSSGDCDEAEPAEACRGARNTGKRRALPKSAEIRASMAGGDPGANTDRVLKTSVSVN